MQKNRKVTYFFNLFFHIQSQQQSQIQDLYEQCEYLLL